MIRRRVTALVLGLLLAFSVAATADAAYQRTSVNRDAVLAGVVSINRDFVNPERQWVLAAYLWADPATACTAARAGAFLTVTSTSGEYRVFTCQSPTP